MNNNRKHPKRKTVKQSASTYSEVRNPYKRCSLIRQFGLTAFPGYIRQSNRYIINTYFPVTTIISNNIYTNTLGAQMHMLINIL